MNRRWNACILLLTLLLTACTPLVPATTPPHLEDPPGTFVVVDEEFFDAGIFQVNYPDGWRVVKLSEAMAPVTVTFASPDDALLITISEVDIAAAESTPDAALYERRERVTRAGVTVYSAGHAPLERRAAFDEIYDAVLQSITVP